MKKHTVRRAGEIIISFSLALVIFAGLSVGSVNAADDDVQIIETDYSKLWSGNITAQAGKTVKWYVNVPEDANLRGCKSTIKIPGLGWGTDTANRDEGHLKLEEGLNFIYEFTPENAEDILFTCWMGSGCHHNYIHVKDEKSVYGVLICGNCKSAPPALHSVGCTLMGGCQASGYGLLVPRSDKSYRFYKFDEEGDKKAFDTLTALRENGISNYLSVKVTGSFSETADSYSFTNQNGEEVNGQYDYDGIVTDISEIEYDGTHEGFEVNAVPVDSENILIEAVPDQQYTGEEIKPEIVITDGDYSLIPRFDYTLEYSDNTEPGTASVKIKGTGAFYSGETEISFEIVSPAQEEPSSEENGDDPQISQTAEADNKESTAPETKEIASSGQQPEQKESDKEVTKENEASRSEQQKDEKDTKQASAEASSKPSESGVSQSAANETVSAKKTTVSTGAAYETQQSSAAGNEAVPKTGDSNILIVLASAIISAFVLFVLYRGRKKRQ